jgi:hypothetical protein
MFMPRERKRSHPKSLLKKKMVAELGYPSLFSQPEDSSNFNFKIIYEEELEGYIIECNPLYINVMEALEDAESEI